MGPCIFIKVAPDLYRRPKNLYHQLGLKKSLRKSSIRAPRDLLNDQLVQKHGFFREKICLRRCSFFRSCVRGTSWVPREPRGGPWDPWALWTHGPYGPMGPYGPLGLWTLGPLDPPGNPGGPKISMDIIHGESYRSNGVLDHFLAGGWPWIVLHIP